MGTLPELSHDEGISHPSKSSRDPGNPPCFSPEQACRAALLSEDVGVDVCCGNGGSNRPSKGPSIAVLAECFQPSPTEAQGQKAQGDPVMFASLATLAERQLVDTGSPSGQGTFQADASVHRCLPDRLGSSLGGSDGERPLGTPVGQRTHQCPGAQSNTPWPESTSSLYTGQACASTYGQSLSRLLCQSPGGHKISALPQYRPGTRLTSLRAVNIPGALNQAADLLSRSGPPPGEWRLHAEVVANLWARFGVAQVDLFASRETTHCQMWFSLSYPCGPLGLDALSHEWPGGIFYAFPPIPLIPLVLERIRQGSYRVLLVAPRRLARHWFPALLRLVHGQPWPLPVRADLLSQVGGGIWPPRPAVLQLWAWPLSATASNVE